MYTTDYFPFAFTEASLHDWLAELAHLKTNKAGTHLHRFLEHLYLNPPKTEAYLLVLQELGSAITTYTDQLEHWLWTEKPAKSTSLARKTAELSYQLLRSTALNYGQLLANSTLDATLQIALTHNTLNLIGLCLRKQALLSICPSSSIWKLMAELYQNAKAQNILDTPVLGDNKDHPGSIRLLLQRNLLFAICNPFHFEKDSVDTLFYFANQHAAQLHLEVAEVDANFTWLPTLQEAPRPYMQSNTLALTTVQLDCHTIAQVLESSEQTEFSAAEQFYLCQRLSGYHTIVESSQPTTAKPCQLITDYQTLLYTLNQYNRLRNIHRVSATSNSPKKISRTFQLEPLDIQTARIQKTAIAGKCDNSNASVHATRFGDYYIAITPAIALQVNQLCLLIDAQEILRLGIVRQVSPHATRQTQQVLIAQFSGTLENVNLSFKKESQQAILLILPTGELELLIPPAKYKAGDIFRIHNLNRQGIYSLGRLLECPTWFMHFKITAIEAA